LGELCEVVVGEVDDAALAVAHLGELPAEAIKELRGTARGVGDCDRAGGIVGVGDLLRAVAAVCEVWMRRPCAS
jgi:hypothetical protein